MFTSPIQLTDVRYNAAEQQFEAAVRVLDRGGRRSYACAIKAPISMSFEQAAEGLAKQALRRHRNRGGMFSHLSPSGFARRGGRQAFDSKRWLEDVMAQPLTSAA